METRKFADENILKIFGKPILTGSETYRLSQFVSLGQVKDRFFIRQTLLGQTYELTSKEWETVQSIKSVPRTGDFVAAAGLDDLVSYGFLVPSGSNDLQKFSTVQLVLGNLSRREEGVKTFTILPTTGCNARCVYCYEEGMVFRTMSPQTVQAVISFLCRVGRKSGIKLQWFGGEPLMASDQITEICRALTEKGVPFTSSMISNGILMTDELAKTAKEEWHLTEIQVSADGDRDCYEARKRYVNPQAHNYDTLFCSIRALLKQDIKVTLRVNYDAENLPGVKRFISDIKKAFPDSRNVTLYFAMLFHEQRSKTAVETYEKLHEIRREFDASDTQYSLPVLEKHKYKVNRCMADSLGDSVVIDPDGNLYHCEHIPGNASFGTIFDDPFHFVPETGSEVPDPKCASCPYLPECKPFRKNRCPDWHEACREFKDVDAQYFFELLARKYS